MKIEISKAAINAFARLSHALGRRLLFEIHGLGDEGTTYVFDKDGTYCGKSYSETGGWSDLDPITAVDANLWKECEAQFAAFNGDLVVEEDDDSELERGFSDVWIDIMATEGHYIINAGSGQVMRED